MQFKIIKSLLKVLKAAEMSSVIIEKAFCGKVILSFILPSTWRCSQQS